MRARLRAAGSSRLFCLMVNRAVSSVCRQYIKETHDGGRVCDADFR